MRKYLALLFMLFAWPVLATTTVTGHIKDLSTNPVTSGTFVRFWLRGCAGNQPTVNGTAVIAPTSGGVYYFDFTPDGTGTISGTLYSTRDSTGNNGGDISCGGSTTSVWYGMQIWVNGKAGPEIPMHAKNGVTLDITNVTPISVTPVVTAPTGDNTYLRLDNTNGPAVNEAIKPAASDAWYYVSNTGNVNNDGFSWGSAFPTISQAETACGSNPCTIWISRNYTGAESPNLFTTSLGYKVYSGGNPITIIDLRANVATPGNPGAAPLYPLIFGGREAGNLQRLAVNYWTAGTIPDSTAGADLTNWISGTFPSAGDLFGSVSQAIIHDSVTVGSSTSNVAGQDGEANIDATSSDKALPSADGVVGGVHILRTTSTMSITTASGVHGKSCSNASTSGATITNCYSVNGENPGNTATSRNYSYHSNGNWLTENNTHFDAVDSGGTPRPIFTFTPGNGVFFQSLSDAGGFSFQNLAGNQLLGLTPSGFFIGSSGHIVPIVIQSSGGGTITHQAPNTAGTFTITDPAATGNAVVDSATQTLTNKTLTSPVINTGISGSAIEGTGTLLPSAGTLGASLPTCTDANSTLQTSGCAIVTDFAISPGISESGNNPVCTGPNTGCQIYIFPNAHKIVRLVAAVTTAPSGCTTNAKLDIQDITGSSTLTSLTPTSLGILDSGAISISITAGHTIGIGVVTTDSGCATHLVSTLTATLE